MVRVSDQNEIEGIPLVPDPSTARLDERHQEDYRAHCGQLVEWLLAFGRAPETAAGYARPLSGQMKKFGGPNPGRPSVTSM